MTRPEPAGEKPALRAIVVGAGFAGLAAAMRLRGHGFDVRVLEREATPGGRARPVRLAGVEVDPCATLVSGADTALRSLLVALGHEDGFEPLPRGALCRAGADGGLHALSPRRPQGLAPPAGIRRLDALRSVRLDRLAARYSALLDPSTPERAAVLDDRSVAEWACLYFGESLLSDWIEPWLVSSTLGDVAETSRMVFLRQYLAMSRSGPALLRGGPGPLAAALAARVGTQFGVEVVAIQRKETGGFEIRARQGAQPMTLDADALVLAVPPPIALAIGDGVLSTAEKDQLEGVRTQPALSVVLAARGSGAPPARRIVVTRPGVAFRTLAFPKPLQGDASALLVAVASGEFARQHAEPPDDLVLRRLEAEVTRLLPGPLREVQEARVVRWAEGLPCFEVGRYRALGRLRRAEAWQLGAGRKLALAGDHLLGPRLEDAAASGLRAADALAGAFGPSQIVRARDGRG